jgi:RimJ/RimL family protein N-acetyltransferase
MTEISVIETDRLRLRPLTGADFEIEAEFYASDRSAYVGGPVPRDQAWKIFAALLGHWVIRGYGFWGIEEKSTGIYCGRAGLWFPEGWPEREVAWALMAHAEGRGIAYEAAKAARNFAYTSLGWTTAISLIDPANTRSVALAQKLGATFDYDYEHPRLGIMKAWRHPEPASL